MESHAASIPLKSIVDPLSTRQDSCRADNGPIQIQAESQLEFYINL